MFKNKSTRQFYLRIFIFLMVVFAHLRLAGSQPNDWGIKVGMSISNQYYNYTLIDIEPHFDNYFGLNIDIFNSTINSDHIAIIGQLSYIQKGCTEKLIATYVDPYSPEGYASGEKVEFKNRIDYISIAILSQLKIDLNRIKPYVFFGPRFDCPFKTKSISTTIYNNIKNNWGLSIGFGSEFRFILSDRLLVEFQYSPDLNEIYKTEILSIRKSSYEVKLGIIF